MHQTVIVVAKYFIFLSLLLTFWVFIEQPKKKKKEFVILGLVGAIASVLLAKIGAHFFYDTRPFAAGHFTPYFSHPNDNGFPSDHTLLASFLMYLSFRYSKKFASALLVLAVLVGLARVQAGVHHLIDIIGSFIFAGLGMAIALLVTKGMEQKTTHSKK